MTSQLVIFRAFFFIPADPKSEKNTHKLTKENSGLAIMLVRDADQTMQIC